METQSADHASDRYTRKAELCRILASQAPSKDRAAVLSKMAACFERSAVIGQRSFAPR